MKRRFAVLLLLSVPALPLASAEQDPAPVAAEDPNPVRWLEGHWTGDLGINVIISFGALMITLFVSFAVSYPNPGLWMFPLAVAVALLVPLVAYPFSKTIWLAIDV